MKVKELIEKLKQLPQDDTIAIAIVSKFYDFFWKILMFVLLMMILVYK